MCMDFNPYKISVSTEILERVMSHEIRLERAAIRHYQLTWNIEIMYEYMYNENNANSMKQ